MLQIQQGTSLERGALPAVLDATAGRWFRFCGDTVRLNDSGASGFIDELDEMLAADCVHEFVIHGSSIPQNERRSTRLTIALSFTVASLASCCAFWA